MYDFGSVVERLVGDCSEEAVGNTDDLEKNGLRETLV